MSNILDTLYEDLKTAMRAKDSVALNALRALKSALTNASIEKGGLGTILDEPEILAVVRKQIKQRQDSIDQFLKANRPELAQNETAEINILSKYLPAALTPEQIDQIVAQAIADTSASSKADMGKVMKRAQELSEGRADGKTLSSIISKLLS